MSSPCSVSTANIDVAAQDVRDRIGPVVRLLPEETLDPFVSKSNADSAEALSIAVAGNLSVRELTEVADKIVKPRIERSSGVGEVSIFGGLERAINIWVDADRLAAYKLPISEVAERARASESGCSGRQRHRRPGRADSPDHRAHHRSRRLQRPRHPHRERAFRSGFATSAERRTAPRSSAAWRG